MSKLRDLQAADDKELEVDLSPMIDMVFLLLTFFIIAAKIIKLKQDPEIEVPEAQGGSKDQDNIQGRIVVNIYEDGEIRDLNGKKGQLLATSEDIAEYVKAAAERIKDRGHDPEIHLRGDRNVEFKHVRKVMKAAAQGGVIKVVFASTANPKYER